MSGVTFDGEAYQRRFDQLGASGSDVHGEANFVRGLSPSSVLDAGCGTGRVAIELARSGIEVVGVDSDPSMLATARSRAAMLATARSRAAMLATARSRAVTVTWLLADVAAVELGRGFDVVVMAGNVPLFTPPGTQAALVAGCARHLAAGGRLVAGFQLNRGYGVDAYDADCEKAGLALAERWATWDRAPWVDGSSYAVSVHTRAEERP